MLCKLNQSKCWILLCSKQSFRIQLRLEIDVWKVPHYDLNLALFLSSGASSLPVMCPTSKTFLIYYQCSMNSRKVFNTISQGTNLSVFGAELQDYCSYRNLQRGHYKEHDNWMYTYIYIKNWRSANLICARRRMYRRFYGEKRVWVI